MEDHKINHHLLKLHPPSSSSTPPPEADQVAQLLGFFTLQTPTCNNQPPYLTGGMSQNFGDAINSSRMMGGKRRKTNNIEDNDKEVIHVRAKRGQATDSHSLAERVRRERINEKLRVLQDLVPGCYKTMGMAVMLDVIINYVRSLQNQIEFLSMKLSSASMFCDFNSPQAEAAEALEQRENPCEAREIETAIMRGEGLGAPVDDQSLRSTWPF